MPDILNINSLCIAFDNKDVIKDFSLSLQKGQRIVVCGPNGCGKTTLLRAILGLIPVKSGNIERHNSTFSYCKQTASDISFPISAEETICMGCKKKDLQSVKEVMQVTGTSALAKREFFSLSGGEKQRISIARCLYEKSDIMLLDEPSSFLDVQAKTDLINTLKNLPEETSVIAVTHDVDLIEKLQWDVVYMKGDCNE